MNFHLSSDQYTATLTFDKSESSANTFDEAILRELESIIDGLTKSPQLNALIITSGKPNIFIAGANLRVLADAEPEEMKQIILLGQRVFQKIEQLHMTTVAAIHGACVGGGFELALACDYRVASNSHCTRIGLPETKLGIIPAWGGSTRLPELIGLSKALPLILSASVLPSKVAQKKGLIDVSCHPEQLLEFAVAHTKKPKRRHKIFPIEHNLLSIEFIKSQASKSLHQKTRGHYPALTRALSVCCSSILSSKPESYHRELLAILELSQGSEAKNLIQLYFASERQKKLQFGRIAAEPVTRAAVIGAGVMGSGIAHWMAKKSIPLILKDVDEKALAKGMQNIENLIESECSRKRVSAIEAQHCLDRITPSLEDNSLHHCDLVIEAATENLSLKATIFKKLSSLSSPHTILATNTSALPVSKLAQSIDHPERLVGIHFFNPVAKMPLVEIVKTSESSDATINTALKFVQGLGKFPVVVEDSPGFVVNRILLPYLIRAGELFEEGHSPAVIDEAMLEFGMPMGPLHLIDTVGIDVAIHVATTLANAYPDRMKVPNILKKMNSDGLLGVKAGSGFYHYDKGNKQQNIEIQPALSPTSSAQAIREELVELMSAEALLCWEEKITATAEEIDFAMVMGTGYPPFRGGPIQYSKNKTPTPN